MSHGTEHHLEEAHHAQHAQHDPFDKRVAISMAIVAATLACVTLLSHRAHNETISNLTEASNQWGYYQSKKNREYMYEADIELLALLAKDPKMSDAPARAEKQMSEWKDKGSGYKKETEEIKEKAEHHNHASHESHRQSNFFDGGELGTEMALIFCSIALLTKKQGCWYAGILVGVIGLGVAYSLMSL